MFPRGRQLVGRCVAACWAAGAALAAAEAEIGPRWYGPQSAGPATKYFHAWTAGAVEAALRREGGDAPMARRPSADELGAMLRAGCPSAPEALALRAASVDARGVHRLLLATAEGRLQYVAVARGRVLAAEPPACRAPRAPATATGRRLAEKLLVTHVAPPVSVGWPTDMVDDEREVLDSKDPLLLDCLAAFKRTAFERCGRELVAESQTASTQIIDGLAVQVHARVRGANGSAGVDRKFVCAFELKGNDSAMTNLTANMWLDPLPEEEEAGFTVSICMTSDICAADVADAQSAAAAKVRLLRDRHRTGELSVVKGYQHVYRDLPHWKGRRLQAGPPASVSMLALFPECFPTHSTVIRDQGLCGSCWAFSAATALITNICAGGGLNASLDSKGRRHEVAVQRMISCNSFNFGCAGGHAVAAAESIERFGMAHYWDLPYMCGGGSAVDHFVQTAAACEAAPWGGSEKTCSPQWSVDAWGFQGLYQVIGEFNMMSAIATASPLFAGMKCYMNFLQWAGGGVYRNIGGELAGGHALVIIGYGFQGLTKYWHIQNSWGKQWGDGGYGKILRGANFLELETNAALLFESYAKGSWRATHADPPPGSKAVVNGSTSAASALSAFLARVCLGNTPYAAELVAGLSVLLGVACVWWGMCRPRPKYSPVQR